MYCPHSNLRQKAVDKVTDNSTGHNRVCPWWLCFTFDNPLRRLIHKPETLLAPYVRTGDTVIDVGAGMGYFSIPLAGLVGPAGHVVAIDIQDKTLAALSVRARKSGVFDRITTYLASPDSLGSHPMADFILAFWMVHEVLRQRTFLNEIFNLLVPGGCFLMAEPVFHVSEKSFKQTIQTALETGLILKVRPKIRFSHSALLEKP